MPGLVPPPGAVAQRRTTPWEDPRTPCEYLARQQAARRVSTSSAKNGPHQKNTDPQRLEGSSAGLIVAAKRSSSASPVRSTAPHGLGRNGSKPAEPCTVGPGAAAEIIALRAQRLEAGLNLAHQYDALKEPGANPLKDLHAELEAAVVAAYAFNPKGDILKMLLDLNLDCAWREGKGGAITPPGNPIGHQAVLSIHKFAV